MPLIRRSTRRQSQVQPGRRPDRAAGPARAETLETRTLLTVIPNGSEFSVVGASSAQHFTMGDLSMDSAGNFVFLSDSFDDTQGTGQQMIHLFNKDGSRRRAAFAVDAGEPSIWSVEGKVDMAPDGSFVVAYQWAGIDQDQVVTALRVRAFEADGTPKGPSVLVEEPDADFHTATDDFDVAIAANGNFLVAWRAVDGGQIVSPPTAERLYERVFFDDGTPAGGPVVITESGGTIGFPDISAEINTNGDGMLLWRPTNNFTNAAPLHARRVNATGQPAGGEFTVTTSNGDGAADVESSANGNFVLAWQDLGVFLNRPVRGRIYNSIGQPATGVFTVKSSAQASDYWITGGDLAVEADGDFFITYAYNRFDPADHQVFYQHYNASAQPVGPAVAAYTDASVRHLGGSQVAVNDAGTIGVIGHGKTATFNGADADVLFARMLKEGTPVPDPGPDPGPDPEPNTPPVASPIAPLVAQQETGTTVIPLWTFFEDAQDPDKDLTFAVTSNTNPGIFDSVTVKQTDGTLTLDYKEGTSGVALIGVTCTDKGGLTASTSFSVTLNPATVITPNPGPQPQPTPPVQDPGIPAPAGTGSIIGVLFDDVDANGRRKKTEAPLVGTRLYLDADGDGAYDVGETTTNTGLDGRYAITGIAAGTYHLRSDLPAGRMGGAADVIVRQRARPKPTRLRPIGVAAAGRISGSVFLDANNNNVQDAGEPAVRRAKVFIDVNGDGVWQKKAERAVKADAGGNYTIGGLGAGTYRVVVAGRRANRVAASGASIVSVTLAESEAKTGVMLGAHA